MAGDIAALGFSIDSTQALGASQNLDKLRGSADNATASTRGLERQALDTQHGLGGLADQTQQLTKTLDQAQASFTTLMRQMQEARSGFDGSTQSLKAWDTAALKVDALGRAFGTTARGLDAYNQSASQLGFSTEQQAQSLQRMTLAIENQTSAGAQLRRVMNEYGISVRDLRLDEANVLLERVAASFSKVADSAKRSRDAQALLGTLDPDALGRVLSPNYVPIEQRRVATQALNTSNDVDRRYQAAREIERPLQQTATQTADLAAKYNQVVPSKALGEYQFAERDLTRGQNAGDDAILRRNAPEGSAFLRDGTTTPEGRLAYYQQLEAINKHPEKDDPGFFGRAYDRFSAASSGKGMFADGVFSGLRNVGGALFGEEAGPQSPAQANAAAERKNADDLAGVAARAAGRTGLIGGTYAALFDENGSSRLGRMYTHLTNGEYGADAALNTAQGDAAASRGDGNMFTRGFDRFANGVNNLLNIRRPEAPPPPVVSPLDRKGDGFALANFGDNSLMRYQQSADALKAFGRQKGDSGAAGDVTGARGAVVGQDGADTTGTEALAAFGAYGKDAGQELRFRRSAIEAQQRNAFRPGGAAVDQADLEAKLASMPVENQGKARAFASFAAQRGGDTRLLLNQNLGDMLDPAKSGGGNMSPQLVRDFNESYAANSKASDDQFRTQSQQRLLDTNQQAASVDIGPNAAGDLAIRQQAYNKALADTSDATRANERADAALKQTQAERFLAAEKFMADTNRQNNDESQRIAASGNEAGGMVANRTAGYAAQLAEQLKQETERSNLTREQQGLFKSGQAGKLGNQALDSSQSRTLASKQELQDAQAMAGFATKSVAQQAEMNRNLEVEKSFRDDIAKAGAADALDGGKRVAVIEQQIERTKTLKNEVAQLNAEAQAFTLGRDASQSAADERRIRALPRSQQQAARALQPADDFARKNGLGGAPQGGDGDPSIAIPGYGGTSSPSRGGNATGGSDIDSFARRMGLSESSGNSGILNSRRYAGTYQFGSERLADSEMQMYHPVLGENLRANQWRGTFDVPGFPDVKTLPDFLASPGAQRAAFGAHIAAIDQHIDALPADSRGLDRDGLRAAAHLGGSHGMEMWADPRQNYNPNDGRTSIQNYYDKFKSSGPSGVGAVPAGGLSGPNSSPGTDAYREGLRQNYSSQQEGAAQDLRAGADVQTRAGAASMRATRDGRTLDAQIARQGVFDPIDPQAGLKSQIAQDQTRQAALQQFAAEQAATDQSIKSNERLAAAYAQGGRAIGVLTDTMKVEQEVKEKGLNIDQQRERFAQLSVDRSKQQNLAIEQNLKGQRDSNAMAELDNSMPFSSEETRGRAQAKLKTQQDLDNLYSAASDPERAAFVKGAEATQNIKETTARVAELRSGFQSMESSGMDGVNSLIMGTGKLKDVAASVTKEWAGLLLKMAEKPLMNAGGDWLSSIFQLGSKAVGMASGVPGAGSGGFDGAGVGSDAFAGSGAGSGFTSFSSAVPTLNAAGAAFSGGVRMFASGGVLDRPTKFFSAGGQANVAGEAGNEALLPLKRMANGDMGVSMGGSSGGGANVTIHAPITVQGGSSSGGKMDPAMLADMQKQLSETMRQAVVNTIADESRPGGSLYR